MAEPSDTNITQPQSTYPENSQQTDSEDSERGDLVDIYDDELLISESTADEIPHRWYLNP